MKKFDANGKSFFNEAVTQSELTLTVCFAFIFLLG